MSANPHWETSLAHSSNLQGIDSLPYAFSLSPVFNRPGSMSMTLPLNAQTDSSFVVRPTHLSFGAAQDSQARTRSYKRGQNYGQAIQELSDVENGFDIYVDSARNIVTRPPTAYVDRTSALFGYGVEPF